MSVWAIGDIHGCLKPLEEILDKINFDETKDTLWFCGDLIGRGANSMAVLELISKIPNKQIVLGNWELYYLAIANNLEEYHNSTSNDGLTELLHPSNANIWCNWLRKWPLFHWSSSLNWCMVHAGIDWQWSLNDCLQHNNKAVKLLLSNSYQHKLKEYYKVTQNSWGNQLNEKDKMSMIFNIFTRVRMYDNNLNIRFDYTGNEDCELTSWFSLPERKGKLLNIVYGHWSRLKKKQNGTTINIDYGCVYGGSLAAIKLDADIGTMCLVNNG